MRGRIFSRYHYCFSPDQLCFLFKCRCKHIHRFLELACEVGCAWGATTVLLRRHMIEMGIDKIYYAIDTFSGFVDSHVKFEIRDAIKTEGPKILVCIQQKKVV